MTDLDALAARFVRFADEECGEYAPTYDRLARRVALEPALLRAAATTRPGQQHPNTFLAAVHHLLGERLRSMDVDEVVSACHAAVDRLAELCATRLVQTNEPRRATFLLPALVEAARLAERPLALVEVGASAGLLLLVDRYAYDYGWAGRAGDPASPLLLDTEVRGDARPPLGDVPIASRVGIDLQPVRTDDADAVAWLRSLVWPDHDARRARLDAALALAAADPPRLVAGDALDVLPAVVRDVPDAVTPVVFHHATLAHAPQATVEAFTRLVPRLAAEREGDLLWLAGEGGSSAGRALVLTSFLGGRARTRRLASVSGHGEWLRWEP